MSLYEAAWRISFNSHKFYEISRISHIHFHMRKTEPLRDQVAYPGLLNWLVQESGDKIPCLSGSNSVPVNHLFFFPSNYLI